MGYWNYISSVSLQFGLRTDDVEQLTLARLVCLIRAEPADIQLLHSAWVSLKTTDRAVLMEHLLADGVHDTAILLIYLPSYLANAKKNRVVGLLRALEVLCEIIYLLH